MELDEIKKEYYKVLEKLAKESGKTIEELDEEITEAINKDILDILAEKS